MRIALVFSLLLAILAVIFALQNPQMADVYLFGAEVRGSTALILIVTFAIGVLVGVFATLPGWISNRRKLHRLRKQVAEGSPTTTDATEPVSRPHSPESSPSSSL